MWFVVALAALIGFGAGLLVGRKNPSIADAAAKVANEAKTAAQSVAPKS